MGKILITGASGQLGREVLSLLQQNTDTGKIVAMMRNLSKGKALQAAGIEIRKGDYTQFDSMVQAFKGIDIIYFISSSSIANRAQHHEQVIRAAKQAGVRHIIYTSFIRKDESDASPIAMLARAHLKTEQLLKASGMIYTILQHNVYMDGLPDTLGEQVLEKGTIYFPAGDGKAAYALRSDLAKVGAAILTSAGHENKTYNISSSRSYSFNDIAEVLSDIAGKQIKYISPSPQEFIDTMKNADVPGDAIDMSLAFATAVKQGEFDQPSDAFIKFTGEPGTSLSQYLKLVYGT